MGTSVTTEKAFEEAIEDHLLEKGGYIKGIKCPVSI